MTRQSDLPDSCYGESWQMPYRQCQPQSRQQSTARIPQVLLPATQGETTRNGINDS